MYIHICCRSLLAKWRRTVAWILTAASRSEAAAQAFSLPQAQALGRVFITPVRRAIESGLQSSACGLRARIIAQAFKPTGSLCELPKLPGAMVNESIT